MTITTLATHCGVSLSRFAGGFFVTDEPGADIVRHTFFDPSQENEARAFFVGRANVAAVFSYADPFTA